MKNIKLIIPILAVALILCSSCNDDFENVFDESASQRFNNLFDSCNAILLAAPNGWDMQYYINSESKGYNLLMNFANGYTVNMAGNNAITDNAYLEDISTYELNRSMGPILAFNTYNDILTPFADPDIQDVIGDFEFVIVSITNDTIFVKGKKNQNPIILSKLPDDIEWKNYLSNVAAMKNTMFITDAPNLTLEVDGVVTNYVFSGGENSIFTVENENIDSTWTLPFIFNQTGFRLAQPESFSGYQTQTYQYNSDSSAIVSIESPNVKFIGPDSLNVYLVSTSNARWDLTSTGNNSAINSLYSEIISSLKNLYTGAEDVHLAIKYIKSEKAFSLRLGCTYNRKTIAADIYYDYEISGNNEISLSNNDSKNSAGEVLSTKIPQYNELAQLLSDTYRLSTTVAVTINNLTFTGTNQNFTTNRK